MARKTIAQQVKEWARVNVPCRGCAVPDPIRTRETCEFCGGSGLVSGEVPR